MTRRSRWARPFAALFALWFAVMVGDPGMLHSCPMHGGHGAHAAAATSAHDAPASHAMHGDHDAGATQAASHQGTQHHKTGPCTCVGQCCAASIAAPLPAVAALHLPATVVRAERPLLVALGESPAAPDLRLPFANGPPTA